MTNTTIYYHADCLDGFGAAYAAWRHFGDQARYCAMHHGQTWQADDIAGRDVFILDFSFPVATLEAMARLANSLLQLDHHVTAQQMWAEQLGGQNSFQHPSLPLTINFDLQKSGARLAWEHFHPKQGAPALIAHIEDQDLWRFKLPETRAFCRALRQLPFDFDLWHEIAVNCASPESPRLQQMIAEGNAVERFFNQEVDKLANGRGPIPIKLNNPSTTPSSSGETSKSPTVIGLAINANALFASELGDRLSKMSGSYGVVWQLVNNNGQGLIKASIRARGQVNVAAIAEYYGGGGHPNAAGFRMPVEDFFSLLQTSKPEEPGT